tara:strand:+ start:514 stop:756 length:243 start_codon:yes stop_codon:yes gene_type:complete
MGLVPAFGMPGILELGIIAVIVLPVIVALVFSLNQKQKMSAEVVSVPDEKHSWPASRWLIKVLKLSGVIGVCYLAWLLFT